MHKIGLSHGDITSQHVLIDEETGNYKLLDPQAFGVVKTQYRQIRDSLFHSSAEVGLGKITETTTISPEELSHIKM